MSDMNLDILQNKIDALVEKIIQKENSDEDFRITYAQILEKINTKMDLFSDTENLDKLAALSVEIRNIIEQRQDIIDGRFTAIKGEFDRINDILVSSFKTDDLVSTYNRIDEQLEKLEIQQNEQKSNFSQILNFIESFNLLEKTNENLRSNFAIVKEQNTIANENITKQIDTLRQFNIQVEDANEKTLKNLETILFTLQEFEDSLNEDVENIKGFISSKVDNVIEKIHETDTLMELLNTNMSTMIQVVGNIFEDEEFLDLQSDVTDILTKVAFLSEALKNISEKSDIKEIQNLINSTELSLITQIDKNSVAINEAKEFITKEIKNTISANSNETGKQLLKISEDINNFADNVSTNFSNISNEILTNSNDISTEISNSKTEIANAISKESNTVTSKITDIANTVDSLKTALAGLKEEFSNEILTQQDDKIQTALNNLHSKFVTQIIQIADNISFEDEFFEINDNIQDYVDELKEKITKDINCIKEDILELKVSNDNNEQNITNMLSKIEATIHSDLNSDIRSLTEGFKLLTKGIKDNDDYSYTLPDIESDLSKIRLDLNKIQTSLSGNESEDESNDISSKLVKIKEEIKKLQDSTLGQDISEVKELFSSINEDVSSISKRTNKLILSSDEVNKTLSNNIDDFSGLIRTFERHSKEFYGSAMFVELIKKVNAVAATCNNISQSNQILNEAFMYLAEWVDSASETFEEMTDDITTIKDSALEEEQISRNVKSLSIKVEEQDAKIEELENKIDSIDEKINKILSIQNDSKETKALLEYIASQVSASNEKAVENEKLAIKMASMEKQLKKIEKNIAIITEYIDEDDEDFDEE